MLDPIHLGDFAEDRLEDLVRLGTLTRPAARFLEASVAAGLNIRRVSADEVGVTFDETSTPQVVVDLLGAFGIAATTDELDLGAPSGLPAELHEPYVKILQENLPLLNEARAKVLYATSMNK